jgi:hypothetical protein
MKKKIMTQGVGPSKLNRDPKAPSCYEALKGCHVAGVPIEELPESLVVKLAYQHTDEGIHAWKAAMERGDGSDRPANRAPVTASEFGRSIEERRDFRRDAGPHEIFEAPDPMKELVEQHVEPGMRGKFLSPGRVDRDGTRGFEIVKDLKGEPVKMGRMVLGQMPEAKARARATFYQKKGSERLSAIEQEHKERQRELVD